MRKNFDRYYGVSEQELYQRSLDDLVDFNLDIIFVNISPGLYSVFKGNHYSGPGNHFWRCVYESGLTSRLLKSSEDRRLIDYRVGLVNMFEKPSLKTVQDLSADEIRQAQQNLTRKIRTYKPKVVAFNGKSIYETYMGSHVKSDFNFGKQAVYFDNNTTNIIMFVLPSSSARCSQLPKVGDKVPFYAALKKLQEHLNGRLSGLSDADIMFPDFKVALNTGQVSINPASEFDSGNEDVDDERDDEDDDDDDEEEGKGGGGRTGANKSSNGGGVKKRRTKIKFVRLNNLPFSQLPKTIVQSLHEQRKSKRGITITTSQNYFNSNKHQKTSGGGSAGAASSHSSDMDTASNLTNDDSLSVDYNNKITNGDQDVTNKASSISSIVLNMVSSGKSHGNGSAAQSNGSAARPQYVEKRSPSSKLNDSRKHLKSNNSPNFVANEQPLVITQMNLGNGFQNGFAGQNIVILNPNDPSLSGLIQQQSSSSVINPQFILQSNTNTLTQYDHVSSQMNEFIPITVPSQSNQQQAANGAFLLDSSMFAQPLIPFMTDLNGQPIATSSSSSSFTTQPSSGDGFITVINCNPNGSTNASLTNAILAGSNTVLSDQKLMYLTQQGGTNNNIQKLIPINSGSDAGNKDHTTTNNGSSTNTTEVPMYLELIIKPDESATSNNKLSEYYTFESLLNDHQSSNNNNNNASNHTYTSAGYDQVALTTLPSSNAGNRKIELFYVKN